MQFSSPSQGTTKQESLDQQLTKYKETYYRQAAKELEGTLYIKDSIESLYAHSQRLYTAGEYALATAMIVANQPIVEQEVDSNIASWFVSVLLEQGAENSAREIADYASTYSNGFGYSRISYELGIHDFKRDRYSDALQRLSSISSSEALSQEQQDYAVLAFGIMLQHQKKHREALEYYARIEPSSPYYAAAQLNSAVANIRQGWWTDGQIAIERAMANPPPEDGKELVNRLLLILGYSQLQNEFYKDARNTFRKITLDSRYVSRALLGIGLCALHLEDYNAAVNMFSRLKTGSESELPVMEAYLLLPFTFERLGSTDQASTLYTEAIAFYEKQLLFFNAELSNLGQFDEQSLFERHKEILETKDLQPYFHLLRQNSNPDEKVLLALRDDTAKLARQSLRLLIEHHINEKIAATQSYLSQSQYGLAKIYDR